jgi:hypothetical protein
MVTRPSQKKALSMDRISRTVPTVGGLWVDQLGKGSPIVFESRSSDPA